MAALLQCVATLRPRCWNSTAKIVEDSNDLAQYCADVTRFSIEQLAQAKFKPPSAGSEAFFVMDSGIVWSDLWQEMPAK